MGAWLRRGMTSGRGGSGRGRSGTGRWITPGRAYDQSDVITSTEEIVIKSTVGMGGEGGRVQVRGHRVRL